MLAPCGEDNATRHGHELCRWKFYCGKFYRCKYYRCKYYRCKYYRCKYCLSSSDVKRSYGTCDYPYAEEEEEDEAIKDFYCYEDNRSRPDATAKAMSTQNAATESIFMPQSCASLAQSVTASNRTSKLSAYKVQSGRTANLSVAQLMSSQSVCRRLLTDAEERRRIGHLTQSSPARKVLNLPEEEGRVTFTTTSLEYELSSLAERTKRPRSIYKREGEKAPFL
ncbi:hypothetical protein BCV69DRAFT_298994 [Microstroma glucosiphilum]|uniref:Uncharacterized protein n=1 Tax=Pseudomicrostroma glucosiphilum TaxID=1684307 RepID=A0A316U9Y9_9BASI|nr:hypothetical protein BCV69DRAFT_298994 [Pseudomicrostroma glucosiphilum]PWN21223.1 hypothetical protein BCV69DRAFT_298994 [Pseudomicrostroma glucosiphilum]